MRINKAKFKYIEHELYNYKQTKKDLALYREKILQATPRPEVSAQSGLSDTTANKAIKLMTSTYILQAERVINAIEDTLDMLGEKHKKLFRLKYIDCMPWQETAIEMGISDRTYFRLRREIVAMVGQKLGLLNI